MQMLYMDAEHLMITQQALIDLGLSLLEMCDYVPETSRGKYYSLLNKIMLRAELDLH